MKLFWRNVYLVYGGELDRGSPHADSEQAMRAATSAMLSGRRYAGVELCALGHDTPPVIVCFYPAKDAAL